MTTDNDTVLTDRFEDALIYATRLHTGQVRKGTRIPYISHLLAVASLVLEAGGTEDEAIAALLHDGPEDQGGLETLTEIRQRFGDTVGDIVGACSDTFEAVKLPWRERKQAYLDHLVTAPTSVILVSCADKLHNARAILTDYRTHGDALWDRFNADRYEVLWYYGELARLFGENGPEVLARELGAVYSALRHEAKRFECST